MKRKKWQEGDVLEYAGRRGITYFRLKKRMKGPDYKILNEVPGFTFKIIY